MKSVETDGSDLQLLQLWRQQQTLFEKQLELKDEEIFYLKKPKVNQSTQTEAKVEDILYRIKSQTDSIPYFHSVEQLKTWILNLQKKDHVGTQTDKELSYSLLKLFAKELKNKNSKSSKNNEVPDKLVAVLKQLDYQMMVNADIKRLLVETVIGNHKNYSMWGSDSTIQKNILSSYNDALVKIGKLNFEIDTLKSENGELNQILEEFLIATIE